MTTLYVLRLFPSLTLRKYAPLYNVSVSKWQMVLPWGNDFVITTLPLASSSSTKYYVSSMPLACTMIRSVLGLG